MKKLPAKCGKQADKAPPLKRCGPRLLRQRGCKSRAAWVAVLAYLLFNSCAAQALPLQNTGASCVPIDVQAEHLDLHPQGGGSASWVAEFSGHVVLKRGQDTLWADTLQVFYENPPPSAQRSSGAEVGFSGVAVQKMSAKGHVQYKKILHSQKHKLGQRVPAGRLAQDAVQEEAFGEEALFFPKRNLFILTGDPVTLRNTQTQAQGCRLEIDTASSRAHLSPCQYGKTHSPVTVIFKGATL